MAKRALSDSDCDDLFSDHKESCLTPPESCGHHGVSRKKRRGIIEKRRRDRINNSLSELRRLVPTAFEKQGSAKLEKAEILQMTVDHLKMIHAKGFDTLAYDPQKFALDYHSLGFREAITETGRYFLRCEGMDSSNPLCQGLMSHLHRTLAQRELANKQAATSSWTLPTPSYQSIPHSNQSNTIALPQQTPPSTLMESLDTQSPYMTSTPIHPDHVQGYHHHHHTQFNPHQHPSPHHHTSLGSSPQDRSSGSTSLSGSSGSSASGYWMPPPPYTFPHQQNTPPNNVYVPNGKPHRPWSGAELAY